MNQNIRRRLLKTGALFAGYSLAVSVDGLGSVAANEPETPKHLNFPEEEDPRFLGEPHMHLEDLDCDLLVAGGGLAGITTALAAARNGARVILVQDRSRLGGNSSSEVKMHVVGANCHNDRPEWREGGILEELRLEDVVKNPQRSWEYWDLILYDKVISEPNIRLLLETTVYAAEKKDNKIQRVMARCDKTESLFRISARYFADCTGDARLAVEAGAETHWGHDARSTYQESLAWETASRKTLGSSILFTSKDYGKPIPYIPPAWARKITEKNLVKKTIAPINWHYGYWWIEWGGELDTIRENETIRKELLAIVCGVWDYIKNSGKFPEAANFAMDWVGMFTGKRESRRIIGDHILTQKDCMRLSEPFDDAVAMGGWGLDEHPPKGFDEDYPYVSTRLAGPYNIPLRSLYSKDVSNLFMAGRNISVSHVAFTSTRVMGTCAVIGQAVGTAVALCSKKNLMPRDIYQNKALLKELQITLFRQDQSLVDQRIEDPGDLARQATITASASLLETKPENLFTGITRDMRGRNDHKWLGKPGDVITLSWKKPVRINRIRIVFDSGFVRELTLSSNPDILKKVIAGPQPETVKQYRITGTNQQKKKVELVNETGNYLRLREHPIPENQYRSLSFEFLTTNGSETVSVFEISCYG